jgi:hypothetical protein
MRTGYFLPVPDEELEVSGALPGVFRPMPVSPQRVISHRSAFTVWHANCSYRMTCRGATEIVAQIDAMIIGGFAIDMAVK